MQNNIKKHVPDSSLNKRASLPTCSHQTAETVCAGPLRNTIIVAKRIHNNVITIYIDALYIDSECYSASLSSAMLEGEPRSKNRNDLRGAVLFTTLVHRDTQ